MAVWCADEAGPYQAIPQPGASWQSVGQPIRYPHEYIRGGTAKLLTLFHPATGQVRVKGTSINLYFLPSKQYKYLISQAQIFQ